MSNCLHNINPHGNHKDSYPNAQDFAQNILFINGANLNLLGVREPNIYGSDTLDDIINRITDLAAAQNINIIGFQSNHEGAIVDFVGEYVRQKQHGANITGVIINPAAFTHTSVAILDALSALDVPFIEVHLSNIHQRESFRTHSYFSPKAKGVICGLGAQGYIMALQWFLDNAH